VVQTEQVKDQNRVSKATMFLKDHS